MNIYLAIFITSFVTYIIRVLPFILFRREIKSRFIRSFLYYVPYITLSVMTFPHMVNTPGNLIIGIAAFLIAIVVSLLKGSLPLVAACSCLTVYLLDIFL